MKCRYKECGLPLTEKTAIFLNANNQKTPKPCCERCYEKCVTGAGRAEAHNGKRNPTAVDWSYHGDGYSG
jgi:hypothetical protein